MSAEPNPAYEPAPGLDATLDAILDRFQETQRIDHAHEHMQRALHQRLLERGFTNGQLRLLEVNLFGSLSGWMEFMLEERAVGRDAVADFARHLRRAFLAHCREHNTDPNTALSMAIELASALMELAANFKRHMRIEAGEDEV